MASTWGQFFERIGYVTLKVTPGCNLKCTYCNVEAVSPKTPKMALERFQHIADLLMENSKSPFVGLEFHGGEPLLQPDDWFEDAVTYGREAAERHKKIVDFPLVTNGTMLSEERLDRLNSLGVRFCLSCDGPPEINDELRGGGERLARTLDLMRRKRVLKGLITVLTESNWNRMPQVMDWFDEIGVSDFTINFLQPQGRGIESPLLSGEQMFHAMRDIFDHMCRTGIAVHEAEVMSRVSRFARGRDNPPRLACHEFQCQAGRSYVAIDTFGTVHACGTDLAHHAIGHLDAPFDDSHYRQTLEKLHDKGSWVVRCFGCNAKQICNHSCPTSDANSDEFKEHDCKATKLLWEYFCANPDPVFGLHETFERDRKERARAGLEGW